MATPPKEQRPSATKTSGRPSLADSVELIRALYYGDPGKGKTTALAHMAKLGPVIHIDAEKRLKAGPLRRLGVPVENIEPFTDVSYHALEALSIQIRERLNDGEKIVGVCWDSGTETGRILLGAQVDANVAKAERQGKERDAWKTEIGDYGDMTEQFRRLLRRFRDLPIHLAMSCLPARDTDEEGAVRVAPALTPAVLRDVMGIMDVVLHCRVELVNGEEEYSALTKPIGRFDAKDSFGILPRVLVNPTFDRLLGYVSGKLTAANDPVQQAAKAARAKAEANAPSASADDGDDADAA